MSDGLNVPAAALLTIAATIALWFLTRFYEIYREARQARTAKEKYLKALYAEIDFNTRDMEDFLRDSSAIERIREKLEQDPNFVPHVTDARHKEIYMKNIDRIHFVGDRFIANVVYFYGLQDKIKSQIDGVNMASFKTISWQGRANVIAAIFATCRTCEETGREILGEMEDYYPGLGLHRKTRKSSNAAVADVVLKERYDKLASDLDRIRSTHVSSP